MKDFEVIPMYLSEANEFVKRHHRHHLPINERGHKFSVGCSTKEGTIVGVGIVTRPVARALDDGWTLEVRRVATDGTSNACSVIYGACRRATFALGYKRLVTYTLPSEGGASLRASGYRLLGIAGGGTWNRINRPRIDKHPTEKKLIWEIGEKRMASNE